MFSSGGEYVLPNDTCHGTTVNIGLPQMNAVEIIVRIPIQD